MVGRVAVSEPLGNFELDVHLSLRAQRDVVVVQRHPSPLSTGAITDVRRD
jgi:hypothetical protein